MDKTLLNPISLEDRKLISGKIMGYNKPCSRGDDTCLCDEAGNHLTFFDPIDSHFYEVIGKLEGEAKVLLDEFMETAARPNWEGNTGFLQTYLDCDSITWLSSHKPEIIQALIEILKEGKA